MPSGTWHVPTACVTIWQRWKPRMTGATWRSLCWPRRFKPCSSTCQLGRRRWSGNGEASPAKVRLAAQCTRSWWLTLRIVGDRSTTACRNHRVTKRSRRRHGDIKTLERAEWTLERKGIYLELHPETKRGTAGGEAGGRGRPKIARGETPLAIEPVPSFVADTAAKTNKSKSTSSSQPAPPPGAHSGRRDRLNYRSGLSGHRLGLWRLERQQPRPKLLVFSDQLLDSGGQ